MLRLVLQSPGSSPLAIAQDRRQNTTPTIIHNTASLLRHAHIPGFLSKLANRAFLRRFARVDEARRNLDRNLVDRRPVLLLQEEFGARRFVEDGYDADAVDRAVGWSGLLWALR